MLSVLAIDAEGDRRPVFAELKPSVDDVARDLSPLSIASANSSCWELAKGGVETADRSGSDGANATKSDR